MKRTFLMLIKRFTTIFSFTSSFLSIIHLTFPNPPFFFSSSKNILFISNNIFFIIRVILHLHLYLRLFHTLSTSSISTGVVSGGAPSGVPQVHACRLHLQDNRHFHRIPPWWVVCVLKPLVKQAFKTCINTNLQNFS